MTSNNNAAAVLTVVLTIGLVFCGLIDIAIAESDISAPTVETLSATGITGTSAVLNAEIIDDGGADIVERRFGFDTSCSCSLGWANDVTVSGNSFSYTLTNLRPGKKYYFQAWARNSEGFSHGEVIVFTTIKSSSSYYNMPQTAIVTYPADENTYASEDQLPEETAQQEISTKASCFDSQTCYSTKEEAISHIPSRVVPRECFILKDGPSDYPWRVISETACAHWVAHQLGIKNGDALCYDGYSIKVKDVIFGRTDVDIKHCNVGDVWTNSKVSYCGIVREVKDDKVFVEHDSAIKGGVVKDWFSSGKCWTELSESITKVQSQAKNREEESQQKEKSQQEKKEQPNDTESILEIIDKFFKLFGV